MAKANKIKIGKVKIDSPTALAPMAGINNATFRYFCRKLGCGLIYSPMIHTDALLNNKKLILDKNAFHKDERPLAIQLVGYDPKSFSDAVKLIERKADIIDINFGCPDTNIVESKAGAYFLKHIYKIKNVVNALTKATNKPITAKIRTGFSKHETQKIIKALNDCGVDGIALHGRTAKQKYSGKANYDEIKKAVSISKVPVIANGDIDDKNMQEVLNYTGAEIAMIGRKAIGNPFIFSNKEYNRLKFIKTFFNEYKKREKLIKISELRQHLTWISSSFDGAAKLRAEIMQCKTIEDLNICIKENI